MPVNRKNALHQGLLLGGTALLSCASLLLEIALTRVYAVLFFYHYVFAMLSIAVLGIGLGAALAHHLSPGNDLARAQRLTLLTGFAVLALTVLIVATVSVDARLLLAMAALLPYVASGMTLATLFAARSNESPRLYWADLSGAGLGAVLAVPLLNLLGGLEALLVVVVVLMVSSICFRLAAPPASDRLRTIGAGVILALALAGLGLWQPSIDVARLATPKPLTLRLQDDPGARTVYTHWDAFARTDVLESDAEPWQKQVFINGAAGSLMPRYPDDTAEQSRFAGDIGYFPFDNQHHDPTASERVFVIGPGGGRDVLFGLLAGSDSITAVEVSPGVVDAVRRFGEYNGRLFDHPTVTVAIDEGRRYLRRSERQFDLISISEVIALTAERSSYILTENYVYTVEAFRDYLDHLAPGGRLALRLYDELTLTRSFTTAIAALRARGLTEPEAARQIVVLLDPTLVSRQAPFRSPLLIVYRDPVTPQEAERLLASIEKRGFIPLFVPHAMERPPLSDLVIGEATLDAMVADFARADISPTTDNRPFFYEFRRGLPDVLRQLLIALALAALLGLAYLWFRRRTIEGPFWPLIAYFALLGAGFMLIELALIQRLTLLLGHPTRALAVGLFAVLSSSGLGSLVGGRLFKGRTESGVVVAALAAGALALAYVALVPALTRPLLSLPEGFLVAASVALVSPLFFLLGMPFPLGLSLIGGRASGSVVPLAWGVNGITSVVGSVGGMALAILWGFDVVMVVGGGIYLVAALLCRRGLL